MSQYQIDQLFETEVLRVTGGDSSRISYPNTKFDPPADGVWFTFSIMPTPVQSPDLAQASSIYRGVFQINVIAPADTGEAAAKTTARDIADMLAADLSGVVYLGPITVYSGVTNDATYAVPVSANYRADFIKEVTA